MFRQLVNQACAAATPCPSEPSWSLGEVEGFEGYYADFADTPVEQFGRALAQCFIFQGRARSFLNEKHPHGRHG